MFLRWFVLQKLFPIFFSSPPPTQGEISKQSQREPKCVITNHVKMIRPLSGQKSKHRKKVLCSGLLETLENLLTFSHLWYSPASQTAKYMC